MIDPKALKYFEVIEYSIAFDVDILDDIFDDYLEACPLLDYLDVECTEDDDNGGSMIALPTYPAN